MGFQFEPFNAGGALTKAGLEPAEGKAGWEELTGCKTLEEYCRLEYQLAKRKAYRLMDASRVYHRLEESGPKAPSDLPVNAKQCRYLASAQHNGKRLLGQKAQLVKVWSDIQTRYEARKAEKAAEG